MSVKYASISNDSGSTSSQAAVAALASGSATGFQSWYAPPAIGCHDPGTGPGPCDPASVSSSAASPSGLTGAERDIGTASEFRIDISSEAGSRFDQNITGFRAEEELGFNAEPYVRTGKFVKVLGL
jgi:hypothetical protein